MSNSTLDTPMIENAHAYLRFLIVALVSRTGIIAIGGMPVRFVKSRTLRTFTSNASAIKTAANEQANAKMKPRTVIARRFGKAAEVGSVGVC